MHHFAFSFHDTVKKFDFEENEISLADFVVCRNYEF